MSINSSLTKSFGEGAILCDNGNISLVNGDKEQVINEINSFDYVLQSENENYFYQNGNFFSANVLLSTDFKRIEYVYLIKDLFKQERENLESAVQ